MSTYSIHHAEFPHLPEHHRLITFTGAGGKTSLMKWFATPSPTLPQRIVVTTTTKILPLPGERLILNDDGPDFMNRIRGGVTGSSIAVVANRFDHHTGKLIGLPLAIVSELHCADIADTILVEADGAARKPLKAPNDTEPVIPAETDLCIAVMGLDAVHQPLTEENVHRHDIFSRITGRAPGSPVLPEDMIRIAAAPNGLFKGCPPDCERIVYLNKTDIPGASKTVSKFEELLTDNNQASDIRWFAGSTRNRQVRELACHPITTHDYSVERLELSPEF